MTERLPDRVSDGPFVLRLWEPGDVPGLHQAITENIDHLQPWMSWISFEPLTVEQRLELVREWRTDWEAGRTAPMAMFFDGHVVGGTGYVRREVNDLTLEIGYWVHVHHLGHGYATRAARLLTSAAFASAGADEVEIHHDKANVRSGRVPARLGFRFMGERPDEIAAPGEVGVDCTWRMTKDLWSDAQ
jgi:ribosomal-protein-serine acetyltransferase